MHWKKLLRYSVVTCLLVSLLANAWLLITVSNLRENLALYRKIEALTTAHCEGVYKVNTACMDTLTDLTIRLGLDENLTPLVATALWNRSMGISVQKARKQLGIKVGRSKDWAAKEIAVGGE